MPIYEYCCKECNHCLEVLQKHDDALLSLCPACNKETLEKCLSAPAIRLKGKGYYETDEKPKAKQRNILQCDNNAPNCCKCVKSKKNNASEKTTTSTTT